MKYSADRPAAHDLNAGENPQTGTQGADDGGSRENTLNRIKCALVTTQVTLETRQGSRARGFDPYDSRMGPPGGDVWDRGRGRR